MTIPDLPEEVIALNNEVYNEISSERVKFQVALIKVANGIVSETSMGSYIGTEMTEQFNDG